MNFLACITLIILLIDVETKDPKLLKHRPFGKRALRLWIRNQVRQGTACPDEADPTGLCIAGVCATQGSTCVNSYFCCPASTTITGGSTSSCPVGTTFTGLPCTASQCAVGSLCYTVTNSCCTPGDSTSATATPTSPTSSCPSGTTDDGQCVNNVCQNVGSFCMGTRCCKPSLVLTECPQGMQDDGFCDNNYCQPGSFCLGILCCKPTISISTCPVGTTADGDCIQNACQNTDSLCIGSLCCMPILSKCPVGTIEDTENVCSDELPCPISSLCHGTKCCKMCQNHGFPSSFCDNTEFAGSGSGDELGCRERGSGEGDIDNYVCEIESNLCCPKVLCANSAESNGPCTIGGFCHPKGDKIFVCNQELNLCCPQY